MVDEKFKNKLDFRKYRFKKNNQEAVSKQFYLTLILPKN